MKHSVKPFSPLGHKETANEARKELQLLALANDILRRENNIKMIEQYNYFKLNGVRLNRGVLCGWRNKSEKRVGSHNYRIHALCRFWGLSLEEMLTIGREELARRNTE